MASSADVAASWMHDDAEVAEEVASAAASRMELHRTGAPAARGYG